MEQEKLDTADEDSFSPRPNEYLQSIPYIDVSPYNIQFHHSQLSHISPHYIPNRINIPSNYTPGNFIQFHTQSGKEADTYYSEELGTIANRKYGIDVKTSNTETTSFTSSNINNDTYNFKVGDKYLNTVLEKYYKQYYEQTQKMKNKLWLPDNFIENIKKSNKYELMEPYTIYDKVDRMKMFFSIPHRSNIFSNDLPMLEKTEFSIEELKDINKKDYAYVTLFFPGYNDKNQLTYSYLIGTLLVAYMLKNCPQNYDLYKQNKVGTKAKLVCMVTPDIPIHIINILKLYYDDVVTVPYIGWKGCKISDDIKNDMTKFIEIQDVSRGNIQPQHTYSKVFTKLNLFNKKLLPYKKVILLDTDLFPLGYFDSLFSINTPAGCIEHRRLQINELGVTSWGYDRAQFAKHGQLIPKYLTDIENIYASDINASLLIVEPNANEFDSMIAELQTPLELWFGEHKVHKGFWLGNNYYDFYFLPEQNYLTKRFSGKWKSVDLGFSSWLIDIENCFGFTFAGFVVKPWEVQSAFHKYSVNPYSKFSNINNKISQKSYGYQIMNQYIFNMLNDIQSQDKYLYHLCTNYTNINFTFQQFDPWEPEFVLKNSKYVKNIKSIEENDLKCLSCDQKKLVYLLNETVDKDNLIKLIHFDSILDSFSKNIYNLHFTALSYHLSNMLFKITDDYGVKTYPLDNTFISIIKYNSYNITNDENHFAIVVNRLDYKQILLKIIKKIIDMNLQVFVSRHSDHEFVQIFRDDIKPLYYFSNNKNKMTYTEFSNNFDFTDFKYFNISYYSTIIDKIINDYKITTTNDMYNSLKKNNYIKVPWIDVFLLFKTDKEIVLERDNKIVKFSSKTFSNRLLFTCIHKKNKVSVINKWIKIQKTDKYMNGNYDKEKLNKFIIESKDKHNNSNKVIFELDTTQPINDEIIKNIFKYINETIHDIYKHIDIYKCIGDNII